MKTGSHFYSRISRQSSISATYLFIENVSRVIIICWLNDKVFRTSPQSLTVMCLDGQSGNFSNFIDFESKVNFKSTSLDSNNSR